MGTRMRGIRHSSSVCSAWLEFGWAPSFFFVLSVIFILFYFYFSCFSRDLAGGFVIAVILSGLCRDQVLGIPEVPSWLPQALLLSEGVPIGPAGHRHARAGGGGAQHPAKPLLGTGAVGWGHGTGTCTSYRASQPHE